jgi:hypothetical protein
VDLLGLLLNLRKVQGISIVAKNKTWRWLTRSEETPTAESNVVFTGIEWILFVLQEGDFHLRGLEINQATTSYVSCYCIWLLYWTNCASHVERVCLIVVFEGHSSAAYGPSNYCCSVKNINHVYLLPLEFKWVGNGENCVSNYGDIATAQMECLRLGLT